MDDVAGIAHIEVQKGAYLSAAVPLLIADKALAASELPELLAAAADDQSHAGLVTDFGLVASAFFLQHASITPPSGVQHDQSGRSSSRICSNCIEAPGSAAVMAASVSKAVICATARQLLQVACRRGAFRLIQYLLPIAAGRAAAGQQHLPSGRSHSCNQAKLPSPASGCRANRPHQSSKSSTATAQAQACPSLPASDPDQQDLTAPDAAGMTLLHCAVQSGCAVAVDALLDGSCHLGIHWQVRPDFLLFVNQIGGDALAA